MATARTRANMKYSKKAYDRVLVTFKKGEKEKYKELAASRGMSFNGLVMALLNKEMEDGVL